MRVEQINPILSVFARNLALNSISATFASLCFCFHRWVRLLRSPPCCLFVDDSSQFFAWYLLFLFSCCGKEQKNKRKTNSMGSSEAITPTGESKSSSILSTTLCPIPRSRPNPPAVVGFASGGTANSDSPLAYEE
jgi:hypothetical protein